MSRMYFCVTSIILTIILLLTFPYLFYIIGRIFFADNASILDQLTVYKWPGVGICVFCVIYRIVKHNFLWIETFSHELTHAFFALILQGRIHSFNANEGSGMMSHSGVMKWGLVPISLAPYCFPLFTYFLLSFRHLMDFHGKWVFDIIIGLTIAFHVTCFKKQIGNHQTDINQYPLLFSYYYIFVTWIVNLCIILVSFFPNMYKHSELVWYYGYGMWSSLARWPEEMWNTLKMFFM